MAKKDSLYFPHDHNAKDDEKILELRAEFGAEGYGVYWMLIESMFNNDGYLNRVPIGGLCLGYGVAKDVLNPIIAFCINVGLFAYGEDGESEFTSSRVLEHLQFREKAISNGKKGANARWRKRENGDPNGGANATLIPVKERIDSKVSKAKNIFRPPKLEEVAGYCLERKNAIDAQSFIDHYEVNGWMRGKNKIKCWKACVRTWEKNNDNRRQTGNFSSGGVQQGEDSGGKFDHIGTTIHVPDLPSGSVQDGKDVPESTGDYF